MKPWNVIQQLESTNSRKDKERILQSVLLHQPLDKEFWEGTKMALNPFATFGVKQVPVKTEETANGVGVDFETFALACTGLCNRSYTGNNAAKLIGNLMEASTTEQWNDWYRRILIKDLRCGVTETTINKVRPNTVPVFACQLAKDAAENENKLVGKKLLDYKLDGVRVLAVVQRNEVGMETDMMVTLYSRNGKVFENFPHIEEQIRAAARLRTDHEFVLDGEIVSTNFQALMTQARRKRDADASDAVYNVFDIIPFNQFYKGRCDISQTVRRGNLDYMFEAGNFKNCTHVKKLDYVFADLGTDEGRAKLDELRDEAARLGLEGIMVKDVDAPYECKRTSSWLKIKPNITVDLTIVDLEEGTGRNEGRLGAIVCEGVDSGRSIRVNVGSGFSDLARSEIWNTPHTKVVGQVVEVRADVVTQNQDGSYSLRFPRFIRFRGFEPGEKM